MEKWGEVVALTAPLIPKSASAPPLVSLLFLLPQPAQASRWVRGLDGRVLEADPVCAWAMWLLCRYLGYQVSCPAVARVLAEQRIATILMACVGIMKILYMKNFCRPIRLAIHPFTTLQSRGHLQFSCLSVLLSFKWPRIIFSQRELQGMFTRFTSDLVKRFWMLRSTHCQVFVSSGLWCSMKWTCVHVVLKVELTRVVPFFSVIPKSMVRDSKGGL